jgi:hypothetical protein
LARLTRQLEGALGDGSEYAFRDISSLSSIKNDVETKYPLPSVVTDPPASQKSSLSEENPAYLLQKEIIVESHRNWDTRAPNFSKLWAFAAEIEKPKQFFTLNRWPPQLQTDERQNEIRQSGPVPESPKPLPRTERDIMYPKPGEKIYPGETFFPFGETPTQQAILAYEIDKDLAEGNRFSFRPKLYQGKN